MPKLLKYDLLSPEQLLKPRAHPLVHCFQLSIDGDAIALRIEADVGCGKTLFGTEIKNENGWSEYGNRYEIRVEDNKAIMRFESLNGVYHGLVRMSCTQPPHDIFNILLAFQDGEQPLFGDEPYFELSTLRSFFLSWYQKLPLFLEKIPPIKKHPISAKDSLFSQPTEILKIIEGFLSPSELLNFSARSKKPYSQLKLKVAQQAQGQKIKSLPPIEILFLKRLTNSKKLKKPLEIKQQQIQFQEQFFLHPKFIASELHLDYLNYYILDTKILNYCVKTPAARLILINILRKAIDPSSEDKQEILSQPKVRKLLNIISVKGDDDEEEDGLIKAINYLILRLEKYEEIPFTSDPVLYQTVTNILVSKFMYVASHSTAIDACYNDFFKMITDPKVKNVLLRGLTTLEEIFGDYNTWLAEYYIHELFKDSTLDQKLMGRAVEVRQRIRSVFDKKLFKNSILLKWLEITTSPSYLLALQRGLISPADIARLLQKTFLNHGATIIAAQSVFTKAGLRLLQENLISFAEIVQIVAGDSNDYEDSLLFAANLREVLSTKQGQLALRQKVLSIKHIKAFSSGGGQSYRVTPNGIYSADPSKYLKAWLTNQFKPFGENQTLNVVHFIIWQRLRKGVSTLLECLEVAFYHFDHGNYARGLFWIAIIPYIALILLFEKIIVLLKPLANIIGDSDRNLLLRMIALLAWLIIFSLLITGYEFLGMPPLCLTFALLALDLAVAILELTIRAPFFAFEKISAIFKWSEFQRWLDNDNGCDDKKPVELAKSLDNEDVDERTPLLSEVKQETDVPAVIVVNHLEQASVGGSERSRSSSLSAPARFDQGFFPAAEDVAKSAVVSLTDPQSLVTISQPDNVP